MTKNHGAEMAKRVAMAAGAAVLSMVSWGCMQDPAPFDPRKLMEGELQRSAAPTQRQMAPLPATRQAYDPAQHQPTTRRVTSEQPQFVRMSLREIMHRAAANNKEVRVAGYDPAISETRVMENEGHYDPILFSNFRYDKQADRTPGTVIPNPANPSQ